MLWVYVFFFEGSSPDDYLDKLRQFFCVGYGVAWRSGFHTMFTPIVVSEFYSKCLTFLVHHFLSFVLTFSDTCLLNFSNGSLTEQTCKNFPRHLNLGIYWPISLTGMKPSFGFCYIYSPGLGTKWSLRKDIKTVFKWGPPKQSKVLITSPKINKWLITQVNRQSGNRAIRIMDNSIPLNVEVVIGILLGSRGKFCLPIALQSNAKPNK